MSDKKDNWFKRHKILTGILIFFVLIIVVSAIGGDSDKSGSNKSSSSSNASQNKEFRFAGRADKQDKDIEIVPGEQATLDGMKITVNSAERKTSLNEYTTAASGKTFLIVNVTLENTSKSAKPYNVFDFRVQTAGGQVLDNSFSASAEPQLNSGDLVQGGKITGNVGFEVPVEEGAQYLIWKPSATASDRVIAEIK